jgi:hypothetical protein
MIELWTAHAKKQFATLTEQTKELSALGQKIAGEGAEPITRGKSAETDAALTRPPRGTPMEPGTFR